MIRTLFCVVAALMFSNSAFAQSFPSKSITVIVGVAPGGTLDTLARLLAKTMTADLKQTVIVENTTGCLLYTSPSPRDRTRSRMPSSA